jgi:hypothetical protein
VTLGGISRLGILSYNIDLMKRKAFCLTIYLYISVYIFIFRLNLNLYSGIPELVDKASTDLFTVFDKDGDGMLNREELIAALRMVGHGGTGMESGAKGEGEVCSFFGT